MSHKRGQKTLTGEDEIEVDIIDIFGDNGLKIKDYSGTNGDVLQKSATTNELEWSVVPPPADNSITSAMFQENAVNNRALGQDAVKTDNIFALAVDTTEIADLAITTAKLEDDSVDTRVLGQDAVHTDNINAFAVDTTEIANNAITSAKIAIQQVNTTHIAAATILSGNLADDCVITNKIADDAITADKIGTQQVNNTHIVSDTIITNLIADSNITTAKIADGAITSAKLNTNNNYNTTGTITLQNPTDSAVVFQANHSFGGKDAGEGSVTIGELNQIGLIIDKPATQGTAFKGLIFGSAFEAVIPANSGTGWFPLQVKTFGGSAGDKFSVDIDGNVTSALKIEGNNFATTGNSVTITNSGIITGVKINGPQHNITANSGTIGFGAFTGTTIVGSSHADKTTVTNLKFGSNTNKFGRIDFDTDDASTTLTGSTYPNGQTVVTNMDLSSATNILPVVLPDRVYLNGGVYYYQFNSGDWRPNDDSSFYNVRIVDSSSTFRGRARVGNSSLEVVAVLLIPAGWRATGVKIFSSSTLPIDCYRVFNNNSGGDIDMLSGQTTNTNTEYTFTNSSGKIEGDMDYSAMVVVHTNSTSTYVSGGYFVLEQVPSGSGG